ncbi:MAG TPA: hypothetical protein VLW47_05435, partial [Thermodesulfobacteriota bacterium]|nr:hypothetical protein [Thermodesulfobacteriota bacterium]
DTNLLQYTITTCMQDDVTDGIWYKNTGDPISLDNIYGATYPQVWDFQDNYLEFYNGADTFDAYLTFYTKITPDKANPAKLKNATISNVACSLYADMWNDDTQSYEYGCGSCAIKGSLIPADKVPTTVPDFCRQ